MVDFMSLVEKEDPDEIYELIDEIAVGSYGSVYKALHLPSQKIVAMKIMEPDEDEELDDFSAEIAVLKDCSHPNIVNYVGAYIKGDEIFISMEFCLESSTRVRRADGSTLPVGHLHKGNDVLVGDDGTLRRVVHARNVPATDLYRVTWPALEPARSDGDDCLTNFFDCTPGHILVLGLAASAAPRIDEVRPDGACLVSYPVGGGLAADEPVPYRRQVCLTMSRAEADRVVAAQAAACEEWVWEATAADYARFAAAKPDATADLVMRRLATCPALTDESRTVGPEAVAAAAARVRSTGKVPAGVAAWPRAARASFVDHLTRVSAVVSVASADDAQDLVALVCSVDRRCDGYRRAAVPPRKRSRTTVGSGAASSLGSSSLVEVVIGEVDERTGVPVAVAPVPAAQVAGRTYTELTVDGNARFTLAASSIVTHNCDGGQCNDIFKQEEKPMQEPYIQSIILGTMKALDYMHGLRIVHRDIKAANILMNSDGTVKLADFGVSALLASKPEGAFTFIGTPYWMAPEVIDNKSASVNPYDMKSDIWSLGITAIELAQITPPLSDVHPMRALFQIPLEESPTLKSPGDWTPDFSDYLAKSLMKDPKARSSSHELLGHPWLQVYEDGVPLAKRLAARVASLKAGKTPPVDTLEELQKMVIGQADEGAAPAASDADTAPADDKPAAPAPATPATLEVPGTGGVAEPLTMTRETGADDSGALADQVKSIAKSDLTASSAKSSRADDDDDDGDNAEGEIEKKAGIEGAADNEQHAKEVLSKTLRRSTLAREKRPQHRLTAKEEVALAEHAQVRRFQKKVSKAVDQLKKKQGDAEAALKKRQEEEEKSLNDRFASKIADVESRSKASQEAKSNQFKADKKRMDKDYDDRMHKVAKERAKEMKETSKALASAHKKRKKESDKTVKAEISAKEKAMKDALKTMPKAEQSAYKKSEKASIDRFAKSLALQTAHRLDAERIAEEHAIAEKHLESNHASAYEHMNSYLKVMLEVSDEVHRMQTESFETLARLRIEQRDSLAGLRVTHAEQFHNNREKHQMELLAMENEQILSMMDIEHKYRSREMVAKIRADTKEFKKQQAKLKKQGTLSKGDFKKKSSAALEAFEAGVKQRQEAFKKELDDDRAYQLKIVEMRNEKRSQELGAKQEEELRQVREKGEEGRIALLLELEMMRHALLERQQRKTAELVREQVKRKREQRVAMAKETKELFEQHAAELKDLMLKQHADQEALTTGDALAAAKESHAAAVLELEAKQEARRAELDAAAAKEIQELVEQYERLASTIVKNQKEELDRADARVVGAGGTPPARKPTVLENGLDDEVPNAESTGEWP